MTAHCNEHFFQLLDRFETCLETPVIPGELSNWSQDASAALESVMQEFNKQVVGTHAAIFTDIVNQDPELHNQVDEMREFDEQLKSQIGDLEKDVRALAEYADYAEPNEVQVESHLAGTIERGLKFVIAARKQEHALTTWYLEAFERDRGVAD